MPVDPSTFIQWHLPLIRILPYWATTASYARAFVPTKGYQDYSSPNGSVRRGMSASNSFNNPGYVLEACAISHIADPPLWSNLVVGL